MASRAVLALGRRGAEYPDIVATRRGCEWLPLPGVGDPALPGLASVWGQQERLHPWGGEELRRRRSCYLWEGMKA